MMVAKQAGKATWTAFHVKPDSGQRSRLGELALDAKGQLKIESAEPSFKKYLTEFVTTVNSKETIGVKSSLSPEAPPFELDFELFRRDDPEFSQGIKKYAKMYFSIELLTEEEAAAAPPEFEDLT
jgi:hypothetical protein